MNTRHATGTGRAEAICIAPEAEAEMERADEVEAVAGRGLRGDRSSNVEPMTRAGRGVPPSVSKDFRTLLYFEEAGTWSYDPDVDDIPRHPTLFEAELGILERDEGIDPSVTDHRRNVTTRDVPVDHLLDERFRVDDAVCEGVRICEPCAYPESRTEDGVLGALVHRGGLNAAVVESGTVRVDDDIEVL